MSNIFTEICRKRHTFFIEKKIDGKYNYRIQQIRITRAIKRIKMSATTVMSPTNNVAKLAAKEQAKEEAKAAKAAKAAKEQAKEEAKTAKEEQVKEEIKETTTEVTIENDHHHEEDVKINMEETSIVKLTVKEEAKAAKLVAKEEAKAVKLAAKEEAKAVKLAEREKKTAKKTLSRIEIVESDDKIASLQKKVEEFHRENERAPNADELNELYPEVYV